MARTAIIIRRRKFLALASLVLALAMPGRSEEPGRRAMLKLDFDRAVAPVLARRCLDCHSGPKPKGGLDLSHRKGALEGGENGPAIVAGQPDESLLWEYVEAGKMPPKAPLPEAERNVLKAWVAAGAGWGTDPIDTYQFTSERRAGRDWWSLQPVMRPRPPALRDAGWGRGPLDAFVLRQLTAKGLEPSPPADRRTLIRRLYFDMLGLPPAPEEVEAFLADCAPGAYERLVERCLASPHYGVRWARLWLDLARYGESNGFEFDEFRPSAWRYRDWVVNSLNRDMPYDEFARRQLAGDVLHPGDPDAIEATGFLVAGAYDNVGQNQQSDAMKAVVRQDELEDMVGAVGQTFLGLTVNCARCHDHKVGHDLVETLTFELMPDIDVLHANSRARNAGFAATDSGLLLNVVQRDNFHRHSSLRRYCSTSDGASPNGEAPVGVALLLSEVVGPNPTLVSPGAK